MYVITRMTVIHVHVHLYMVDVHFVYIDTYMYLVFNNNGCEVWCGECIQGQLSVAILHIAQHTSLYHQLTKGRINDGVKRQKVNYFNLPFAVFSENF